MNRLAPSIQIKRQMPGDLLNSRTELLTYENEADRESELPDLLRHIEQNSPLSVDVFLCESDGSSTYNEELIASWAGGLAEKRFGDVSGWIVEYVDLPHG